MMINPIIPIPVMAAICVVLVILKRRGIFTFIRQLIIVALLFTLNLRISIPTEEAPVVNEDVDILLVVDNTISMLAKDYDGHKKRLDGVRNDIDKIIEEFPSARMALITFNTRAEYTLPYTYQNDLIVNAAKVLNGQNKKVAKGTNLNLSYDAMEDVLTRKGAYDDEEDRIQLVFYFSDGENTDEEELDSFEDLSDYIDGGLVLGYGSSEGTEMYAVVDSYWEEEEKVKYYNDEYDYVDATSAIDEDNLNQVAEDLGIDYCYVENEGDSYDAIEDIRKNVETGFYSDDTEEGYIEIYWIFAAALAAFLFMDFIQYRIKMGKER